MHIQNSSKGKMGSRDRWTVLDQKSQPSPLPGRFETLSQTKGGMENMDSEKPSEDRALLGDKR